MSNNGGFGSQPPTIITLTHYLTPGGDNLICPDPPKITVSLKTAPRVQFINNAPVNVSIKTDVKAFDEANVGVPFPVAPVPAAPVIMTVSQQLEPGKDGLHIELQMVNLPPNWDVHACPGIGPNKNGPGMQVNE